MEVRVIRDTHTQGVSMVVRVPLYRNYDEFSAHVVQAIMEMIRGARGSMVTFNAKKVALIARALRPPGTELEIKPVVLTLVKDVLERFRERGYLEVLGKTKHGVKYAVRKDSPLWRLAKNYGRVSEVTPRPAARSGGGSGRKGPPWGGAGRVRGLGGVSERRAGVLGKGKDLLERWVQGDPRASPHLAVIGRTGAGKTTFARHIVLHLLLSKKSVAILDFDGEYSDLPLETLSPPFPLPRGVPLAWLLSQASRPSREEGGGHGIAGLISMLDVESDIDEMISRVRHDLTLPYNVRFAILWRLQILKMYFHYTDDPGSASNVRYDLSPISDVRERQIVEQMLASLIAVVSHSPGTFLLIEEGVPGEWLTDILALARRRAKRVIYVSQVFPSMLHDFEIIIFTPYFSNPHPPLPLPVNPLYDRGVWWVGGLGVHRLKHVR